MASGEFSSMTALHNAIPDATPKPLGWGTYASNPNVHFFLCLFIDMIDEVPGAYFSELLFPFVILRLGNEGSIGTQQYHSKLPSSLLRLLTAKCAQIFKRLLLRLPGFTQIVSHLTGNMGSRFQHSWAKCLSIPPGRIPGRSSLQIQCSN